MTARAGEWQLLGEDGDPLPGDSYPVTAEAKHYTDTSAAIRDQVVRLRQIGSGSNDLVGQYAPALCESANDLADHLDQTQARFDTVATELTRWGPTLERGRTESWSLLTQAESTQQQADANKAPTTPVDKTDAAAVQADQSRDTRLGNAQSELTNIRARYQALMHNGPDGVRTIAAVVAKRINDASQDGLKDSWWDSHVRKWIHDHANLLKMIADVLTWIATAIVISILIFATGGLVLALLLTAVALTLHSILALNGDGSWVDVAIDAFALVTMGGGALLASVGKGAFALDAGVTAFEEATFFARNAFAKADGLFAKAGVWITRSNAITRNVNGLAAGLSRFSDVLNTQFESSSWLARLTFGDKAVAGLYDAVIAAIKLRGPSLLLNTAKNALNGVRLTFVSGISVDSAAKFVNPAVPLGPDGKPFKSAITGISDWIEAHTVRHGGYW